MSAPHAYVGRFAPSPTGPLHAGSLVAALASWLDARAWNNGKGGRWLVRIEDLDRARCVPGATQTILRQLHECALVPDGPPAVQSDRQHLYITARDRLIAAGLAYACGCSRKDIDTALQAMGRKPERHGERVYPGTCRAGLQGRPALAWRFRSDAAEPVHWFDRRLGAQQQNVLDAVGDFVIQRADGPVAYQLAVVVDDAQQQVTHVVRGADLADNTARQILLQRALVLPTPRYLHTPLVLAADGQKLSKQNGARALETGHALLALQGAAAVLALPPHAGPIGDALATWVAAWRGLYNCAQ